MLDLNERTLQCLKCIRVSSNSISNSINNDDDDTDKHYTSRN
jgi:hypothetical protein